MRTEAEILGAVRSLAWLDVRASCSPDALTVEAALLALEWVLAVEKPNPLPDLLAEIRGLQQAEAAVVRCYRKDRQASNGNGKAKAQTGGQRRWRG